MATGSIPFVGTVIEVFEEVKVSERFRKRLIKLDIDEDTEYPQRIVIEFVNDKTSLLNKYSAGDKVTVDTNVRGKDFEKEGKVSNFTKLNGWRIKGFAAGGGDQSPPQGTTDDMPGGATSPQATGGGGSTDDGDDDLPF
jgi:hypothetical protein